MNWGVEVSLPAYTPADIKRNGQISRHLAELIKQPCTGVRMCGRDDLRFRAANKEEAERLEEFFTTHLRMQGFEVVLRYTDSGNVDPDRRILVGSFDCD